METETLILIGIFLCLLSIFFTLVGVVLYSGLFCSFEVGAGAPPVKSLVLAYKFGKGPYSQCGYLFNETISISPDKRTIGLYYDDPKKVPQSELRWAVGSIVAEGNAFPDVHLLGKFQDKGFKVFHVPSVSTAVITQFPYTTPLSIFIAIYRVYPALGAYIKGKKLCAHPFVEIYDGSIIHFMAPLARQDEFYVPEALEDKDHESESTEATDDMSVGGTPMTQQSVSSENCIQDSGISSTSSTSLCGGVTSSVTPDENVENKARVNKSTSDSVPSVPYIDTKITDDNSSQGPSSFDTTISSVNSTLCTDDDSIIREMDTTISSYDSSFTERDLSEPYSFDNSESTQSSYDYTSFSSEVRKKSEVLTNADTSNSSNDTSVMSFQTACSNISGGDKTVDSADINKTKELQEFSGDSEIEKDQ